jgi:tetratricopeptide (TPR) repeat protein
MSAKRRPSRQRSPERRPVARVSPPLTSLPSPIGLTAGSWWRPAVIVLAGLLAYANSFSGAFILDDVASIVENRQIREWWRPVGLLVSERELPVAGRPVVNASFALNYALGGLNLRGYHIGNLLVHLACALVLFGVVRRICAYRWFERLRVPPLDFSFVVALLWVLHPLNTEAVNYLTQRTETMMALFYLLTIYASIRAAEASSSTGWIIGAVLACATGMACKESMVSAPVMVMLFDRVFVFDSITKAVRARWPLYAGLSATWLVLAWLMSTGPRMHSAGFSTDVSPWTYLLNQTVMIVRYLGLAAWPRGLVVDYGWPATLTLGDVLPHALLVSGLAVATVMALIRWPPIGFFGAWFFITLAPTSSIVPIATEVGAERRMYLPLMALIVLAVIAGVRLQDVLTAFARGPASTTARKASVMIPIVLIVSIALGARTAARNLDYRSSLRLAETTLERYPTSFAHHALAVELIAAGRRDEAMAHLRQAVPGAPRAYFTLGIELFARGQWEEAARNLQTFVQLQPSLVEAVSAHEVIGRVFAKQERWREAIDQYRMVLTMNPSQTQQIETETVLADAFYKIGSYDEALVHYRRYLDARPTDVHALTQSALSFGATGRWEQAIAAFRRAVEAEPRNGAARRNLANALYDHRDLAEAAVHAKEAASLRPNDPAALDLFGRVLALQGQVAAAIAQFEKALTVTPDDAEIREHLVQVQRLRQRGSAVP